MSSGYTYSDPHQGETIVGECPYCHLPIYVSDPVRKTRIPPGEIASTYHWSCGKQAEGLYWESVIQADAGRLRGCGYVVELKVIRPVG